MFKRRFLIVLVTILSLFLLVACDDNKPGENGNDDVTFVWSGLEDRDVVRGDKINLLEGVSVKLEDGTDLTDQLEVSDDDDFNTHLADSYKVEYKVTDPRSKTTEKKSKNFIVKVGHNLANNDFSLKQYGWKTDKPGGSFDATYDGEAVVNITNSGTTWWALQIYQNNVAFKEGKTYKLTMNAKSSTGKSVSVGYEDPNNNYAMLNPGTQTVKLTEDFKEYTMFYTATSDFSDIKAVIYLGHQLDGDSATKEEPHEVVIKNIYIEEVNRNEDVVFTGLENETIVNGDFEFDPLLDVTATLDDKDISKDLKVYGNLPKNVRANASYYLTYVYEHENGDISYATKRFSYKLETTNEYEAVNGNFEQGLVGWEQDVNQTDGTGSATFLENEDDTVSIIVHNPSVADWHIQLQQTNPKLTKDTLYKIKATLRASEKREVGLELVNPADNFANIMPKQVIEIDEEWKIFEFYFSPDNNYTAKIGLLLGRIGQVAPEVKVDVSELQIHKVESSDAAEFKNVNDIEIFVDSEEPNWLEGIEATAQYIGKVNVYIIENNVDLSKVGSYEILIGAKNGLGEESTAVINVEVVERPSGVLNFKNTSNIYLEYGEDMSVLEDQLNKIEVLDGSTDITDTLTYDLSSANVDNKTPGIYTLVLEAGEEGNKTTKEIAITVYEKYQIINSDFEEEAVWEIDNTPYEYVDGTLVLNFEGQPGGNPWDHQIHQENNGQTLRAGVTYKITVRLKTSKARDVRIWVEDAARGFSAIVNDEDLTKFSIKEEDVDKFVTLSYEFVIGEDLETNNAKYVIMLGNAGAEVNEHTVTVDSFVIEHIRK